MTIELRHILLMTVLLALPTAACAQDSSQSSFEEGAFDDAAPRDFLDRFFDISSTDRKDQRVAEREMRANWHPGMTSMALELARLARPASRERIFRFIEKQTGKKLGRDIDDWWQWLWKQEVELHPDYPTFKARLYGLLDPRFAGYFSTDREALIRLDEVRWGGVEQDGIPPLRGPKMLSAGEATYLDDDHVVFGLEVNGDARAYPKRILAWHEMFVDTVGDVPVAGVYCTLCGTMILYETTFAGVDHQLGTSGFLYRSNKLMYDQATQSLWSTIEGRPVIGPLVGKGIELKVRGVVTTTWGEWRRRHPETTVLSLDTGHRRDYGEGAAYREYFATDELMFTVPEIDRRLANKAEVLALDFERGKIKPLAIAAKYLKKHSVFHDQLGDQQFVVLTDSSGANRVYETNGLLFESWDQDGEAVDENGGKWQVTEQKLLASDGQSLARLPAHRAFWFGWYSAHPETRLVK